MRNLREVAPPLVGLRKGAGGEKQRPTPASYGETAIQGERERVVTTISLSGSP
jgi:hypothetical protein